MAALLTLALDTIAASLLSKELAALLVEALDVTVETEVALMKGRTVLQG